MTDKKAGPRACFARIAAGLHCWLDFPAANTANPYRSLAGPAGVEPYYSSSGCCCALLALAFGGEKRAAHWQSARPSVGLRTHYKAACCWLRGDATTRQVPPSLRRARVSVATPLAATVAPPAVRGTPRSLLRAVPGCQAGKSCEERGLQDSGGSSSGGSRPQAPCSLSRWQALPTSRPSSTNCMRSTQMTQVTTATILLLFGAVFPSVVHAGFLAPSLFSAQFSGGRVQMGA
jgi:hypothetical protein